MTCHWKPHREELAWAAGFFDGEGTVYMAGRNTGRLQSSGRPRDYPTTKLAIAQYHDPAVLHRFQTAVAGVGRLYGPMNHPGRYGNSPRWELRFHRHEEMQAVLVMLWPFLSDPKKSKAIACLTATKAAFADRRVTKPRAGRKK